MCQEIHVISPLCGDLCDWISVGILDILVIRSFILSSLWRCYSQLATDIVTDDLFTFYVIKNKNKTCWPNEPVIVSDEKQNQQEQSILYIYNHDLPVIRSLKWVLCISATIKSEMPDFQNHQLMPSLPNVEQHDLNITMCSSVFLLLSHSIPIKWY